MAIRFEDKPTGTSKKATETSKVSNPKPEPVADVVLLSDNGGELPFGKPVKEQAKTKRKSR